MMSLWAGLSVELESELESGADVMASLAHVPAVSIMVKANRLTVFWKVLS
jgi:hypothetical protein